MTWMLWMGHVLLWKPVTLKLICASGLISELEISLTGDVTVEEPPRSVQGLPLTTLLEQEMVCFESICVILELQIPLLILWFCKDFVEANNEMQFSAWRTNDTAATHWTICQILQGLVATIKGSLKVNLVLDSSYSIIVMEFQIIARSTSSDHQTHTTTHTSLLCV